MDFVPLAVATAIVWKVVTFSKNVLNQNWNAALTQMFVWGAGIGVGFLLATSDFSSGMQVGDFALGDLNAASIVLFGFALGSSASATYDIKKAVDGSDSAVEPKMFRMSGRDA